jgi:hypothetical protein
MSGDVGGSNITPTQAAIDHQRVFNSTVSSKYKIGAPAVARGSKAWLQVWHLLDRIVRELIRDFITAMDRGL